MFANSKAATSNYSTSASIPDL